MKRGFILVEFASAVAIIAILAAILFPVFARAREKARQSNCLTNMLNVGVSLRQYAADYCGGFPPNDLDFTPLLHKYLPDERVLDCPSTTRTFDGTEGDYSYKGGYRDDDRGDLVLMMERILNAHNEGCNYLCIDGHARWFKASSQCVPSDVKSMPGVDTSPLGNSFGEFTP